MKTAFVFPGQGAQKTGMLKDLYEAYPLVREVFEEADDTLGFSLTQLCFEGPDEELMKTFNTQPAILTASTACCRVLMQEGIRPDIVAGHSLGEYSALVAAGALSFADAVKTVRLRGQFMQDAVPLGEGAMAAILGLDDDTIKEICHTVSLQGGAVQAVNFNCPGQTVIAGAAKAVETAAAELKKAGAKRAVMLSVSAPFHSTLMEPAAKRLAEVLEEITINDAEIPVVANVNGRVETAAAEIKQNLVAQAASPVLWIDCTRTMRQCGADVFVEAGPGKTLCGFNKKIDKSIHSENVEDIPSLQKTLEFFQGVR
ncbi:ACP S-malonyltransferase [Megasphaera vaginalis (ex Srinivasan et al. 2021)]|uniref:Malonyl CoA-acyl carrier protein transacylase n=1 Tax=Megasphaera vaginalis (ex Srinivasan et al. 2021) TaxID=1111454 RepID=U7ULB6_9FIRM|nr:ACP S-malonyltransferase [Megasphaera vaginalis (ex Srinivasan et al. 2021)]ERT59659.1 [acyl-carrier-protein] S-malonyltransferase [Megasphaera vaginalis (ex Srinivasan et al. 2021)]